jgi:hypothetical protein
METVNMNGNWEHKAGAEEETKSGKLGLVKKHWKLCSNDWGLYAEEGVYFLCEQDSKEFASNEKTKGLLNAPNNRPEKVTGDNFAKISKKDLRGEVAATKFENGYGLCYSGRKLRFQLTNKIGSEELKAEQPIVELDGEWWMSQLDFPSDILGVKSKEQHIYLLDVPSTPYVLNVEFLCYGYFLAHSHWPNCYVRVRMTLLLTIFSHFSSKKMKKFIFALYQQTNL